MACFGLNVVARAVLGAALAVALAGPAPAAAVNVYSYREPALIQPLFDAFTKASGIEVKAVFADKGLIERLYNEGRNSPADVLLTVDAGRLVEAVERDLAQPLLSPVIAERIPPAFRDKDHRWFALTMRARVLYVARDRVAQEAFTYEALADPKWKGRICIRSGQHLYNLGLFAAMIAHHGEAATRTWLAGVKANLARRPAGNERQQIRAVHAGECDLAIANTYYMGKMLTNEKEPEQKAWAAAARIVFPTFAGGGTHVNVSGMLLARHAPNREQAVQLMEFLAGDAAQRLYAEVNFEYPVNARIPPSEVVRSWGSITPDSVDLSTISDLESEASRLVDEVQFND